MKLIPLSELEVPDPRKRLEALKHWSFDDEAFTLDIFDPYHYWIDLSEIVSCAEMLDWIYQINTKNWGTAEVISELVEAFDILFYPQANLCSGGVDRGRIDPHKVAANELEGR